MRQLLVATNNPGKLREFVALLRSLESDLVTPADLNLSLEVEENGQTFAENARLKALAFAQASGLITVGDDSGLEVEALAGGPGLYSARYAGPGASDADRRAKLMQAVRRIPAPRTARFRCALAVAQPDEGVEVFEGTCEGEIVLEERGTNGFGYDPIFFVPAYGGTLAEMPSELKNQISHRARAAQAALPYLRTLLNKVPSQGAWRP
jgi:XTP/dITP diphosphohydrolase